MATEAMYDTVNRAHRLGVKVAAGTDVGMPHVRHGDLAYEMVHMAKAGMSNMAVIGAATRVAAEACGLDGMLGEVREGRAADLIVVDGNPLDDLSVLQRKERISVVMQAGRLAVDRRKSGASEPAQSTLFATSVPGND
jgi:imidazolonepropionase-like amidohydrolase